MRENGFLWERERLKVLARFLITDLGLGIHNSIYPFGAVGFSLKTNKKGKYRIKSFAITQKSITFAVKTDCSYEYKKRGGPAEVRQEGRVFY